MDLNILWFILITVLFAGFFLLEGFDYGVGMIAPLLGNDEKERRLMLRTILPVWDGNEVWMITAGGALFAAFPHVYATMFSAFYMALFLLQANFFDIHCKYPPNLVLQALVSPHASKLYAHL